jgi:hypothetical protein
MDEPFIDPEEMLYLYWGAIDTLTNEQLIFFYEVSLLE